MLSNEEFVKILNNTDNIRIGKNVAKNFHYLDKHEIESETMLCLWEAASKFDKTRKVKFTTYYHSCLYWKLLQLAKKKQIYQKLISTKAKKAIENKAYEHNFELHLDGIPEDLAKLLRQKYLEKKTLKEIGKENGYSYERARILIKKAITILKNGV